MALTKIPGSLLDTASGINGLIYPTSDGTAGQFLKTDGSGNLTFATVTTYTDSDVETYLDGGTSTPTFASATVSGALTVTGDLNITGDINSYNVTDLDVTDQTITLGAGQIEANSGGSGIIVDGSLASILWDEPNDWWDYNKGIRLDGEGLKLSFRTSSTSADGEIYTGDTFGSNRLIISGDNGIHNVIDGNANGVGDWSVYNDNTSTHLLYVTGSNGHVGIGESSVDAKFHVKSSTTSTGVGSSSSPIAIIQNERVTTGSSSAVLRFDTNEISGTNQYQRAGIGAEYDGASNLNGRLMFSTADSSGALIERLRINGSGNVGINVGSPQGTLHIADPDANTDSELLIGYQGTSAGGNLLGSIWFGSIESSGSRAAGIKSTATQDFNASDTPANLTFWTTPDNTSSATQKMVIESDGNVGIGTGNPNATLHLNDSGNTQLRLTTTQDSNTPTAQIAYSAGSGYFLRLADAANNEDVMIRTYGNTIFNGGNVGIGNTNPQGRLSISGPNTGSLPVVDITATGTGTFQRGVRMLNSGMNSGDHIMYALGRADNARNMGQTYFYFDSAGSTSNRISMGLHSVDDVFNIVGTGNVGIGTTNPSEKLHVESRAKIGNITLAGNSSDSTLSAGNANFKISTLQFTGGAGGLDFDVALAITGGIQAVFQVEAAGAGDTYTNDGTISSLSDERVKTDIQDLTDGLEIVKQLRPVTFKYNDTSTSEEGHKLMGGASDKIRYGFIAQEVEQIAPQYIEYSTRKINNEEVDDFRNLSTTRMLPMLFKAVQELSTELDAARARITELENA